jgi:hypothetical protein
MVFTVNTRQDLAERLAYDYCEGIKVPWERGLNMETIDVRDIPEPIARGLKVVARMARTLGGKHTNWQKKQIKLHPVKGGRVLTSLNREEIYADSDE